MNNIKLTEKVKGDFEKWFTGSDWAEDYPIVNGRVEVFYEYPLEMQKGVYERYFRERWGILFKLDYVYRATTVFYWYNLILTKEHKVDESPTSYDNSDTAFTEAVNQASQIAEKEEK